MLAVDMWVFERKVPSVREKFKEIHEPNPAGPVTIDQVVNVIRIPAPPANHSAYARPCALGEPFQSIAERTI
jgi:hypothetical protein